MMYEERGDGVKRKGEDKQEKVRSTYSFRG